MNVYIEAVIVDNFIITTLIALAAYRFLHVKKSIARIIVTSSIGTIVAVFYPFIALPNIFLTLIKVVVGVILSIILFAKKYSVWRGFICFMVMTFMYGGLMFCVALMMNGDVTKALNNPPKIPLSALILCGVALYLVMKGVFLRFHKKTDVSSYIYDVSIKLLGKSLNLTGFCDTGNRLYDCASGLPVVIVSARALVPIFDDSQLTLFFGGFAEKVFCSSHYIKFSTLGSSNDKMLIVQPDSFQFYNGDKANIVYDVAIGITFSKINDVAQYDAILHPALLEKGI